MGECQLWKNPRMWSSLTMRKIKPHYEFIMNASHYVSLPDHCCFIWWPNYSDVPVILQAKEGTPSKQGWRDHWKTCWSPISPQRVGKPYNQTSSTTCIRQAWACVSADLAYPNHTLACNIHYNDTEVYFSTLHSIVGLTLLCSGRYQNDMCISISSLILAGISSLRETIIKGPKGRLKVVVNG